MGKKADTISLRMLQQLLDIVFEGVVIHEDGKIVYANQYILSLFGYSLSEMVGTNVLMYVAPEYHDIVLERIRSQAKDPIEIVFREKDGTEFSGESTALNIVVEERKIRVVSVKDITSQKRAEEALKASEEKYRSMTSHLSVGVYRSTPDPPGRFLEVNPAMVEMFGYRSREQMLQIPVSDVYDDPKDRDVFSRKLMDEGHVTREELLLRRQNGTTFIGTDTAVAVRNTEGEVQYYDGIIEDITERVHTENALRQSESTLRTLFETMVEGVVWISPDYRIQKANQAAQEILRLEPCEEEGEQWRIPSIDVIQQDGTPVKAEGLPYRRAIDEKCPIRDEVIGVRFPDGEVCWINISVTPLIADGGDIGGAVCTFSNITERKELENQYQQAQKMEAIGRLAGGIAHDFNNVLTAILGNLELMEMKAPPDGPRRKHIPEIRRAVQHAHFLTQKLLAFARKTETNPRILDLNDAIRNLLEMLGSIIREDIQLIAELEKEVIYVYMDVGHIQQMVANLVINARDAMPEGGRLSIETSSIEFSEAAARRYRDIEPGRYALLSITDTGFGMSEDVREHIFEPFYTTKEQKGSGLGLSIVYGIVEQYGGIIEVESREGVGSTFRVYLPVSEREPPLGSGIPETEALPTGKGTIILVEDEEMVRDLALQILTEAGFTVVDFQNGSDALEFSATYDKGVDLLLTDVVMRDMSGVEMAEAMRKTRPEMKIIYMSGYTAGELTQRGIEREEVEFIAKPFNATELASRIIEILDRP